MTRYEFWAVRGGAPYVQLRVPADSTPMIRFVGAAEIKSTVSLQAEPDARIAWITDLLSVVRVRGAERTPLGLFYVTTSPVEIDDEGRRLWTLTGYDRGYAVRNLSVLEHSLTIRAGTGYAAAIREQLLAAGIKTCTITDTAEVLPTDHAWETGTTRYRVIEDLLAEINYRSLYFDGNGIAVAEPWQPAGLNSRTHHYGSDGTPPLYMDMTWETDTFDAANVFVDIVSSADLPAELRATAENDEPTSPLSIARRGCRVVSVQTVTGIASQDALQTHVNNRMLLSMMGTITYSFSTCADTESDHRLNDSILLLREDGGMLEEQDWTLACVPGGKMTHTARRVYYNIDH